MLSAGNNFTKAAVKIFINALDYQAHAKAEKSADSRGWNRGTISSYSLSALGIEPHLIEIRSVLGEIGAGLHITGNGVRALYQLGVGKRSWEGGPPVYLTYTF